MRVSGDSGAPQAFRMGSPSARYVGPSADEHRPLEAVTMKVAWCCSPIASSPQTGHGEAGGEKLLPEEFEVVRKKEDLN